MRPVLLRAFCVSAAALMAAGCSSPTLSALPDTATTSTPAPATTALPGPQSAAAALAQLPMKGRAPMTGYDREEFGARWTNDVQVSGGHNGCDTRSDVLRRDLRDVTIKPGTHGCVPLTGSLSDPYTGAAIAFQRGQDTSDDVQIDHVVALADAWQTGAQLLDPTRRRDLGGDPLNLLAVDGPTNQQKRAADAASWLPPDRTAWCPYVARQIAVKTTYGLWVTPAEHDAMTRVLAQCPDQALPDSASTAIPALVP